MGEVVGRNPISVIEPLSPNGAHAMRGGMVQVFGAGEAEAPVACGECVQQVMGDACEPERTIIWRAAEDESPDCSIGEGVVESIAVAVGFCGGGDELHTLDMAVDEGEGAQDDIAAIGVPSQKDVPPLALVLVDFCSKNFSAALLVDSAREESREVFEFFSVEIEIGVRERNGSVGPGIGMAGPGENPWDVDLNGVHSIHFQAPLSNASTPAAVIL